MVVEVDVWASILWEEGERKEVGYGVCLRGHRCCCCCWPASVVRGWVVLLLPLLLPLLFLEPLCILCYCFIPPL